MEPTAFGLEPRILKWQGGKVSHHRSTGQKLIASLQDEKVRRGTEDSLLKMIARRLIVFFVLPYRWWRNLVLLVTLRKNCWRIL